MRDKSIRIRWEASKTAGENAREKLPELARVFFAAGRKLAGGEPSLEAMHQFRLLTKRFRYTLELFRPYFGPALSRRIEDLRRIQVLLGEINDCATTQRLVLGRNDLRKSERDRLARLLKKMAAARVARFRRHWQAQFPDPGRERRWTQYMSV